MKDASPQTIYLKDYTPFGFRIDEVALTFRLDPSATRVISRVSVPGGRSGTLRASRSAKKTCRCARD